MSTRPAPFDLQAKTYDQRVGLSEQTCQAIGHAVRTMAQAQAGEIILELGAGTGMIGTSLAGPPLRYIGLDLSRGMLAIFRQRLSIHRGPLLLLQADGNRPWPLADATVRVIFGSRALHLLDSPHLVRESWRVAQPDGAVVIIGRIQRQDDSVATMMQQTMQRLLRQHGLHGRAGVPHQRQLLVAYDQQSATRLAPIMAARWTVTRTPWQSIAAWHATPGLGGIALPGQVKRAILDALCSWAAATFGNLHQESTSEEAYVLQGVRLHV